MTESIGMSMCRMGQKDYQLQSLENHELAAAWGSQLSCQGSGGIVGNVGRFLVAFAA